MASDTYDTTCLFVCHKKIYFDFAAHKISWLHAFARGYQKENLSKLIPSNIIGRS